MKNYRTVSIDSLIYVKNTAYQSYTENGKTEHMQHPFFPDQRITNRRTTIAKPLQFEGFFHGWGNTTAETDENGVSTDTIAIIEDNSGKVYQIDPADIIFTDR